ncbi:bile acid:sodium symporter family protein [Planctomicrobium sp. SH664]|uniref:bile acid:sodium symporter family protein n=1 Tax=Planctomicrobium sp. SH664 TaxID=3448125 RepID=UPI003F5CA48D
MRAAIRRFRPDWFLTGMLVAVALAWLFPAPGAKGGWLQPELITKGGIALVFYLHGLGISFAALRAGTLQWRLHLLIQGCAFLFFPALGFMIYFATQKGLPADLRLGFFYLCALPSTVSSSIAMTAAARGNVPAALFNATLSSLLGVFLTPFWISLITETSGVSFSLQEVILDLVIWLICPLLLGQFSRLFLAGWAARNKKLINTVDRLTILMLIYTSFCDSIQLGIWTSHGLWIVAATFIGCTLLFFLVLFASGACCDLLGIPFADRIAVVFCGSKKSLATGVPMANLIFGAHPGLGLVLLPMMIYHPLQLILCGALASHWALKADRSQDSHTTAEVGSPGK